MAPVLCAREITKFTDWYVGEPRLGQPVRFLAVGHVAVLSGGDKSSLGAELVKGVRPVLTRVDVSIKKGIELCATTTHGDSLIQNTQSGQQPIDLEDVGSSRGSDVFKAGSSYAVDGFVANNAHCECSEAGADSRVILSQNHVFFPEESVLIHAITYSKFRSQFPTTAYLTIPNATSMPSFCVQPSFVRGRQLIFLRVLSLCRTESSWELEVNRYPSGRCQ